MIVTLSVLSSLDFDKNNLSFALIGLTETIKEAVD